MICQFSPSQLICCALYGDEKELILLYNFSAPKVNKLKCNNTLRIIFLNTITNTLHTTNTTTVLLDTHHHQKR